MKLQKNFDTSIQKLLDKVNPDTFFLSDWNKSNDILNFDIEQLNMRAEYHSNKNVYFFSDEFENLKKIYSPSFDDSNKLRAENFAIVSNCTVASFLCLYQILQTRGAINSLILAPTYFSYIKVLQDFNSNIFFIDCYCNDNIFNEIVDNIEKNKINTIIVTEPLFGTGLSLPKKVFEKISIICEKNDIYFLIDYSYGGMKWNDNYLNEDKYFIDLIKYKNVILIMSICKRIFLNGIKHGVIVADSKFIKNVERASVYTVGCLSEQQILIYKQLYKIENKNFIIETINKNNIYYRNNYHLLTTLLTGTQFNVSYCDSGYFCLVGIPKKKQDNSLLIAEKILNDINILTIPHDRYIFNCNEYYYFRVNLAINQSELINSINILLQTYFNGIN